MMAELSNENSNKLIMKRNSAPETVGSRDFETDVVMLSGELENLSLDSIQMLSGGLENMSIGSTAGELKGDSCPTEKEPSHLEDSTEMLGRGKVTKPRGENRPQPFKPRMAVQNDEISGQSMPLNSPPNSAGPYTFVSSPADSDYQTLSPGSCNQDGENFEQQKQEFDNYFDNFRKNQRVRDELKKYIPIQPLPTPLLQLRPTPTKVGWYFPNEKEDYNRIAMNVAMKTKVEDLKFRDKDNDSLMAIGVHQKNFVLTLVLLERMLREEKEQRAFGLLKAALIDYNNFHQTPLYLAVDQIQPRIVELFMQFGADPNALCRIRNGKDDGETETPLHCACRKVERLEALRFLLEPYREGRKVENQEGKFEVEAKRVDIDARNSKGKTGLHIAVESHHVAFRKTRTGAVGYTYNIPIIKELLQYGASPLVKGNYGQTPLHFIGKHSDGATLHELLGAFMDNISHPGRRQQVLDTVDDQSKTFLDMLWDKSRGKPQAPQEVTDCIRLLKDKYELTIKHKGFAQLPLSSPQYAANLPVGLPSGLSATLPGGLPAGMPTSPPLLLTKMGPSNLKALLSSPPLHQQPSHQAPSAASTRVANASSAPLMFIPAQIPPGNAMMSPPHAAPGQANMQIPPGNAMMSSPHAAPGQANMQMNMTQRWSTTVSNELTLAGGQMIDCQQMNHPALSPPVVTCPLPQPASSPVCSPTLRSPQSVGGTQANQLPPSQASQLPSSQVIQLPPSQANNPAVANPTISQLTQLPSSPAVHMTPSQITRQPQAPQLAPSQITRQPQAPQLAPSQITRQPQAPQLAPSQITRQPQAPQLAPSQISRHQASHLPPTQTNQQSNGPPLVPFQTFHLSASQAQQLAHRQAIQLSQGKTIQLSESQAAQLLSKLGQPPMASRVEQPPYILTPSPCTSPEIVSIASSPPSNPSPPIEFSMEDFCHNSDSVELDNIILSNTDIFSTSLSPAAMLDCAGPG